MECLTARRRAAVVATLALVAAVMPASAVAAPAWTLHRVLSRIDRANVVIGRWSGRVEVTSTLCSGDGRGRLWAGTRHWHSFTCTWTVFDRRGAVDRDVTFRVQVMSAERCAIRSARFGSD